MFKEVKDRITKVLATMRLHKQINKPPSSENQPDRFLKKY